MKQEVGHSTSTGAYETSPEKLSLKKLEQLFFLSYKYSQGSFDIQSDLIKFIRLYYGRQDQKLVTECIQTAKTPIFKFAIGDSHRYAPSGEDGMMFLEAEYGKVDWGILSADAEPDIDFVNATLRIWRMDAYHLLGRYYSLPDDIKTARDKSPGRHSSKDTSLAKDYILNRQKTEDESLDAFFSACRESDTSSVKYLYENGYHDTETVIEQVLAIAKD